MMLRLLIILFFCPLLLAAQTLSEPKQKAINNYVQFVNHLTEELQSLGPSMVRYYGEMLTYKKNSSRPVPQYICGLDAKSYYYEEATKTSPPLGPAGAAIISKAEAVRAAFQKIDENCKAIEIYFRLKDFESDNFKRFAELVSVMEGQVKSYRDRVMDFQVETEKVLSASQPYNPNQPYHQASQLMRDHLVFEADLLDSWTFNIAESVHTGWPTEKAQKHILDGAKKIELLAQSGSALKYPASSTFKSFIESAQSLQQTKKSGVDGFTFEKQQSDKHSNDLYFALINYYNNAEVSFYNNFISQASADGFRGVYYVTFVPLFNVRTAVKNLRIEVTPFDDKAITPITIAPVSVPVSALTFASLSNYVDFINEGVRQISNMMNPIRNLNSSAAHGKARMKSGSKVSIDYYYKNFELPVTLYQQTLDQSKSLPKAYQKSLNDQAETLNSILTEINQWNNLMLSAAASKQLAKDSLDFVYSVVGRCKELVEAFDARKERLFKDVRNIVEAYKPLNLKSSWFISGKAMLNLVDEDNKELKNAKLFLLGKAAAQPSVGGIEQIGRDLISDEFKNLAGIEKLGRYNGNCPYTPYEDIVSHSKTFSELLLKARDGQASSSYFRHPYNQLVHHYNQSIIYQYNKFTELSKVPLLKMISQMELYEIIPPEKPEPMKAIESKPDVPSDVKEYVPEIPLPDKNQPAIQEMKGNTAVSGRRKKKETTQSNNTAPVTGFVHDTVRITDIIRIETVRQDTVYVSKVDTVYVGSPEGGLSMDGYATNNMVLLLDVSGSMNTPEKLPLLKKSVFLLVKVMRAEDEVAIVTYSGKVKLELPPTSFKEENKIRKVIERLKSEGQTDANTGIMMAYQTADKNYIRGGNNRIILATDGEFTLGSKTLELVRKFAAEDIFLTVFNFGKSTTSAKALQDLAKLGRGNYEYITQQNVDAMLLKEAKSKRTK
jgi:Ca-activated chloride channel homolog